MLAIFTAVFGFLAPFLPELLKWLNRKADQSHEIEMFKLRMQAGAQEHTWKMEEIDANADIAEAAQLHTNQQSFGIELLDAAASRDWPKWLIAPIFYLFSFLDFLNGMIRPAIALWSFGFYVFYKYSSFKLMEQVSDKSFSIYEGVSKLWTENDWAVLTLVLGFWFGQRGAKYAFGKFGSRT